MSQRYKTLKVYLKSLRVLKFSLKGNKYIVFLFILNICIDFADLFHSKKNNIYIWSKKRIYLLAVDPGETFELESLRFG